MRFIKAGFFKECAKLGSAIYPGPLLFGNYFTYLYFCYVNCQKLTYIEFINRARNFTTDKHNTRHIS